MKHKDPLPMAIAFACSVALVATAFAGLAALAFLQLGSLEQEIVVSSGFANASLYVGTIQTGNDHANP